jgi:nucleoside 2-deoxyribosyltransferase
MRLMATGFVSAAGDADPAGWAIENFSLPVNLMLAISSTVVFGDAETCLQQIARSLAD